MLIEIIRNTPRWVFLLFIVLLVMGYQQSRDRTASRRPFRHWRWLIAQRIRCGN
ncbi:hypothetical protein [Halomonas sp. A29]|uniref:hypothetical protein n=1 Tax=Halomonas sp. A29 TaxID=3102786 RepID=UPI00398A7FD9